jgi:hypothetical protein
LAAHGTELALNAHLRAKRYALRDNLVRTTLSAYTASFATRASMISQRRVTEEAGRSA